MTKTLNLGERTHKSDLVGCATMFLTLWCAPQNVFYLGRKKYSFSIFLSLFYGINNIIMVIRYPLQSLKKKKVLKYLYRVEGPQRHYGEYGIDVRRTDRQWTDERRVAAINFQTMIS